MKRLALLIVVLMLLFTAGCSYFAPSAPADTQPVDITDMNEGPVLTETADNEEASPVPTEAPTEAPTQEPTQEPTPTPYVTTLYKVRCNELNVRREPDLEGEVIGTLHYEDRVEVIGRANEKFTYVLYEGEVCCLYSYYIVPADEKLYGYVYPMYEYKKDDDGNIVLEDGKPVMLTAELIDIRLVIPGIEVYQIFGTEENFTGNVLYTRSVPVLQTATAKKLKKAFNIFKQDGYTIKIYDCYRPKSVQFILYDIVKNSSYIANPYKSASNHNRAAAVDMTLIGPDGVELDFPTPMHTFNSLANRGSRREWTEEQRKNVEYMTEVMVSCGFKTINSEWWHFSDNDYLSFMVLDIDMVNIPMYTASQLGY